MKKLKTWILISIFACMLVVTSCAPVIENTDYNMSKPVIAENSHITIQHIVNPGFFANYIFDYVEDKENGYGCYVYDGNESGSIFCFKLDQ